MLLDFLLMVSKQHEYPKEIFFHENQNHQYNEFLLKLKIFEFVHMYNLHHQISYNQVQDQHVYQ